MAKQIKVQDNTHPTRSGDYVPISKCLDYKAILAAHRIARTSKVPVIPNRTPVEYITWNEDTDTNNYLTAAEGR